MAYYRPRYDCTIFYEGKRVGCCTVSDVEAFKVLMRACHDDAARVLREYAYFSAELRAILEKVAAKQTERSMRDPQFVGEQLRYYRASLGLTQSELGAMAGWTESRVNSYERGEALPSVKSLNKLLDALRRRADEIGLELPDWGERP